MKGRSWFKFSEKFFPTAAPTTLKDLRDALGSKQEPAVIKYFVEIMVAPQANFIFCVERSKLKSSVCHGRTMASFLVKFVPEKVIFSLMMPQSAKKIDGFTKNVKIFICKNW